MTSRWFNLIVPGILDPKNDPGTWDFQAQVWLFDHGAGISSGFNYSAGVFGASIKLDEYATLLARQLRRWEEMGFSTRAIGHSNGCRLILRALELDPELCIDEPHLFAPACNEDCSKSGGDHEVNGLNLAADRGQIGKVFLYCSPDDHVVTIPGLSYGPLGNLNVGPKNVSMVLAKHLEVREPVKRPCGHGDWVGRDFVYSMQRVANLPGGL